MRTLTLTPGDDELIPFLCFALFVPVFHVEFTCMYAYCAQFGSDVLCDVDFILNVATSIASSMIVTCGWQC